MLLEQLELMDSKMREVADDIARHDSDRLLANGRFIAERFATARSSLADRCAAADGRRGPKAKFRTWRRPRPSEPVTVEERERVH